LRGTFHLPTSALICVPLMTKWIRASPASSSSFVTVLMLTSATRLMDRIDEPSQSIERIWTRVARGSLFMRCII
jgi:hypothetical protein